MTNILETKYLGLKLKNPIIIGSSNLTKDVSSAKKMEAAGAAAIVLPSIFEEQIKQEKENMIKALEAGSNSFAEGLNFIPEPDELKLGPEVYVENLKSIKDAVNIPVIASINGSTSAGWVEYAKVIEEAGADAIELNIHVSPGFLTAEAIEHRIMDIAKKVNEIVSIPVSIKLSNQFSSIANLCKKLEQNAKCDGFVLLNRFYSPDINTKSLELYSTIDLSTSAELSSRLTWAGILHNKIKGNISITGGVHDSKDVIKSIMAGASSVQMVSSILINGVKHITKTISELEKFIKESDYSNLKELRGVLSFDKCPNPEAYQRQNYMRLLKTWSSN